MKFSHLLLLIALSFYFLSCNTQKRIPYYLENVIDTTRTADVSIPELRIQKNDLLSIQVYSASTKPELSDVLYNLPCNIGSGGENSAATCGYLVDASGNIEYPRLGTIHVEGMTKKELAAEIIKRLTQPVELLKDPTVITRFLNYKVTVLGEVGTTGVVTVLEERITVLQAIALAGGIPNTGKKNTVKILRETNGKREIGLVDLTSDSLFRSPYYNLVQNDMILVEPTRRKLRSEEQSIVAQRISFALTLITSAAFIYNIFK